MYTCFGCNTVYDLSQEHRNQIGIQCMKEGIATTLVLCPECHAVHVVGGEKDWDEIEGCEIINMFGFNMNHHNAPKIDGILTYMGVRQ